MSATVDQTSTSTMAPGLDSGAAAPSALQPTSGTTRTLVSVIELGVLGDLLLRAGGLGVNITLWCWALLIVGVLATPNVVTDRRRLTLLAAAAFFAAVPTWRADEALVLFSGAAVLVLLVLLTWTAGVPQVSLAGRTIGAYLGAAQTAVLHIIAGAVPLMAAEARARARTGEEYRRPAGAVLRGLVMALPVIVVFGALLMQADAAYATIVRRVIRWDSGTVMSHAALIVLFAWLAAAYLTASRDWTRTARVSPWTFRIGAIEAGTVLALVDALFLSFVLVQARYLFGGVTHVLETAGLTYAEYARRGFFELVVLSALALPLLIVTTSGARIETPVEKRVHRALAGTLVTLLLIMMGSALSRMNLYQAEYGWTLSRAYATTLMLWIGGSMLWFAATSLRGVPERFMIGSISGALGMLAALVIVNPAGTIVRANAARVAVGRDFDVHREVLGIDGIPTLLDVLPAVSSQLDLRERCAIRFAMTRANANGTDQGGDRDWRKFTIAAARARNAIAEMRPRIDATLGPASSCDQVGPAPGLPRTP